MNILHVVNISFVLPYYIGDQFDFFREKGYHFFVACSPSEHFIDYAKHKNFTPVPLKILREINIIEDIKSILTLIAWIKKNKIDIIVGHTPKGALIGMIAGYLAGVKMRVYFRHGIMYETSKGAKRLLLKAIEKLTGRLACLVVCVSNSVVVKSDEERLNNPKKNILLNRGTCNGVNSDYFTPNSVDDGLIKALRYKFNINSDTKVLGYVGRLVNDKGIVELIEAWQILLTKFSNIVLLLVGPFEKRDEVSETIKNYIETEESIICTGLVEDARPYYALMDVFVLPSYREGFPTVVLEASSMQLPVITTRATGCKDSIIENKTGIFSEINASDLADKVELYFMNEELIQLHGCNGRNFVLRDFQQKVIWEEIEMRIFNDN